MSNKNKMYKNQYHSVYLFKIVLRFSASNKVGKTVNKFPPNFICLLINEIKKIYFLGKWRGFTIKIKIWKKYCVIISLKIKIYNFFQL